MFVNIHWTDELFTIITSLMCWTIYLSAIRIAMQSFKVQSFAYGLSEIIVDLIKLIHRLLKG